MAEGKQPVRDKDLDPVPKIPRSWGLRWVWNDIFRIAFLVLMLVVVVVMKDECAQGVSNFMGAFDTPADAAGTPGPNPNAPLVPEGWELKSIDEIDLEKMFPEHEQATARDGGAADTASRDASSPAPTDRSPPQPPPAPPPAPPESSPTGR